MTTRVSYLSGFAFKRQINAYQRFSSVINVIEGAVYPLYLWRIVLLIVQLIV